MDFNGTNISSLLIQIKQNCSVANFDMAQVGKTNNNNNAFIDDAAYSLNSDISSKFINFEYFSDNFAIFKDIIGVTQNSLSAMQSQGESIRDLILKAKEEGCTEENIDAIQKEVNARIAQIQQIRENAKYGEINPFKEPISMEIPHWEDLFGVEKEKEESTENEITDMLASFDIDMNIDGGFFSLGGTATINIGYTEDGNLQITVDTAFDFDLSALEEMGVQDENALDIINNFLALITGQQNGMGAASNFMDSLFANASASIMGDGFQIDATNTIDMTGDSSKNLQGQIIQHAAITLDSTANLAPSIAINIL